MHSTVASEVAADHDLLHAQSTKTVEQFYLLNKGINFSESYSKVTERFQHLGIPDTDATTTPELQVQLSEQGKSSILKMRKREKAVNFLYATGQAKIRVNTRLQLIDGIFSFCK